MTRLGSRFLSPELRDLSLLRVRQKGDAELG